MSVTIHPTAQVASSAEIGDGAVIGHCAVIEEDVIIGEGTRVDAFASVRRYTRLGRNNHIHSYAMVGGVPQDLKFHGETSWLEIGDNNTIREFATLHRGTETGGGVTRVGSRNLLMAYTHVAHDCTLGDSIIMSNNATLAGHVEVQSGAILGGLSAVHQFVRIGRNAFIGGMSGIGMDVPPFMLASGPRADLHGPNLVGLRRMGASRELISALRGAYKLIWLAGKPRQEALLEAEKEYGSFPEIMELLRFMREGSRGVLAASHDTEDQEG